jgi:prefoldin alpha subunit
MESKISEEQLMQTIRQEEQMFNGLLKEAEKVNNIIIELEQTKKALEEIEKKPKKLLINLGTGVAIEVEVKSDKCLRLMGENLFTSDTIKNTKEWTTEKKEKLTNQLKLIEKRVYQTQQKIQQLGEIVNQINQKKKELMKLSK